MADQATAAQLNLPAGLAFDALGNLYIGDRANHRVRKIFEVRLTANAGADQQICAGAAVTLGAMPAATGGTATYSFNWTASPADPSLTSPTDENPTVSPTVTTTYTLTVTDADLATHTNEVTVTVNALPTATVSGDASICPGDTTIISAALAGVAPWNLTWSDGFEYYGVTSCPATRKVGGPFPGTTTYTVTAVSDANCTGISSGNATVIINPLPTATVSGDATICAGSSTTLTATLTATGPWNLMWSDGVLQSGINASPATRTVSPAATTTYTVTAVSGANCTGTSSGSATVTVGASNPPVIGTIIVPVNPTPINTAINTSADFTAECDNDDHTATWNWGDNSTSAGTIDQSSNSVTGSHTYTAAGVYTATLTVTDGAGNSGTGTATAFVVIYDPNAGFVTGGGWIDSPSGAYVADPSLSGKANFGFVSKYQQGNTIPTGNTEFNFKAGNLNFHSTVYEWLVIAGPSAKYKGEGTIDNIATTALC